MAALTAPRSAARGWRFNKPRAIAVAPTAQAVRGAHEPTNPPTIQPKAEKPRPAAAQSSSGRPRCGCCVPPPETLAGKRKAPIGAKKAAGMTLFVSGLIGALTYPPNPIVRPPRMKVTSKSRWRATQKSWTTSDAQRHRPEVGLAETATDLPQARLGIASALPARLPLPTLGKELAQPFRKGAHRLV